MSEWKDCKIADAPFEIIDGDRGTNYPKQHEFNENGYCLFLNAKNVTLDGFYFNECYFISKERDEILRKGKLQRNDIILTTRGTVGNIGFFNERIPYENIRINSGMVIIRPDTKRIIPEYTHQLFKFLKSGFDIFATGSAQPQLPIRDLKEIPILLPPLPEQRAIAGVLSSLDDKIDLLHRQNKTLEGMADAVWRKMFVEDADPGWKKGKLGDLAKETIGGDWGEDEINADLVPVICLRGIDLQDIKAYGFSDRAPLRFIKATSLEKRSLKENDILIAGSGIGPIGKSIPINTGMINSYPHPVIYSNFCKRLRCKSRLTAYFIEFMIYELYQAGELDQFHMGTSLPNFNMKGFLNFDIIIPSNEVIEKFSSFLTDWYNLKYVNQIRTLSRLRDTLLPKLMSGEVRVKV